MGQRRCQYIKLYKWYCIISTIVSLLYYLGFGGIFLSNLYWLKDIVYNYIYSLVCVQVELDNTDPVYEWVLKYLIDKQYLSISSMNNTTVKTKVSKKQWWEPVTAKEKHQVDYLPAPGQHYFMFQNCRFWANQTQGEADVAGWDNHPFTKENLYITCMGGGKD